MTWAVNGCLSASVRCNLYPVFVYWCVVPVNCIIKAVEAEDIACKPRGQDGLPIIGIECLPMNSLVPINHYMEDPFRLCNSSAKSNQLAMAVGASNSKALG